MNIYTYTSNNPDKPGYYAEVVNSEGEIVYTTGVYPTKELARWDAAYEMAANVILRQ